jgi:hypothetical protein
MSVVVTSIVVVGGTVAVVVAVVGRVTVVVVEGIVGFGRMLVEVEVVIEEPPDVLVVDFCVVVT